MGNAPSKVSHGRTPHKLSKSRIARSRTRKTRASAPPKAQPAVTTPSRDPAPDLISIPYSATSTPSPDDEDRDEVKKESSDRPFLTPPKVQRRLSLFRSKSSQETSERRKSRRTTIIGSPAAPSGGDGVSRAHSLSTHNFAGESQNVLSTSDNSPSAGDRASWAYDMSSYEAQRILNLVRDHNPPLPRSQTSISLCETAPAETQSPVRRHTSSVGQPESTPISRSNSEISLHPPMRRRSLIQTPGVATRTRLSPNTTRSRRSSIRHSHPPTPSISRQPSFETDDTRFLSLPPLPIPARLSGDEPRLLTPKDTDYSTTGAFKFGSLRITNGSPASTPRMTAARGVEAEESGSPAISDLDCFPSAPARDADMASAKIQDSVQSSTIPEGNLVSDVNLSESGRSARGVAAQVQLPLLSVTEGVDWSGLYVSELQMSPVDVHQEPPASPVLKTQSKHAAVDDDLFEDDDQLEISGVEVLDIRIDPSAKSLPPRPSGSSQPVAQGIARSDSGFESNAKSESSQSCNSLTKADSGYSSNLSLRSLRNETNPVTLEKETERSSTESERNSSKTAGRSSRRSLEIQPLKPAVVSEGSAVNTPHSEKAPSPPPKDGVRSPPLSQPAAQTASGMMARKPMLLQPAAIDMNKIKDKRGPRSPGLAPPTPASARSEDSVSSLSIGNNTQKQGRLQRFLSLKTSARQPLTVHETHSVDNKIPSIPKEVEDKLREHTGLYPMTARRLALKSQMSKETLKTILSVGSLEVAKDNELPPTPSSSDDDTGTMQESGESVESSLKQTFSSMQSNFKSAAVSMMQTRREIVRKPVPTPKTSQKQDTEQTIREDNMLAMEAELISYTSITSSLGSNAYDVAAKAMQRPGRPGRPSRSQSMTTRREHHMQLRTYSLNTAPSSTLNNGLSLSNILPKDSPLADRRRSSPPISIATRSSVRSPPPRSPHSPQGPAVMRSTSHNGVTSSMSGLPPRASKTPSSGRRGQPTSVIQPPTTISGPLAPRNSLDSKRSSSANSRHDSISPIRSESMREPRGSQLYCQNINGVILKHQSSLDGAARNQLQGVHVPQPAHRGPALGAESSSHHWNPQNSSRLDDSRVCSSQLEWTPPYVPRGHHRRNLSAGSRPYYHQLGGNHTPYRILHSYNSPAYRNAPIWG